MLGKRSKLCWKVATDPLLFGILYDIIILECLQFPILSMSSLTLIGMLMFWSTNLKNKHSLQVVVIGFREISPYISIQNLIDCEHMKSWWLVYEIKHPQKFYCSYWIGFLRSYCTHYVYMLFIFRKVLPLGKTRDIVLHVKHCRGFATPQRLLVLLLNVQTRLGQGSHVDVLVKLLWVTSSRVLGCGWPFSYDSDWYLFNWKSGVLLPLPLTHLWSFISRIWAHKLMYETHTVWSSSSFTV